MPSWSCRRRFKITFRRAPPIQSVSDPPRKDLGIQSAATGRLNVLDECEMTGRPGTPAEVLFRFEVTSSKLFRIYDTLDYQKRTEYRDWLRDCTDSRWDGSLGQRGDARRPFVWRSYGRKSEPRHTGLLRNKEQCCSPTGALRRPLLIPRSNRDSR